MNATDTPPEGIDLVSTPAGPAAERRDRVAEALRVALDQWTALGIDGTDGVQKEVFLAAAALEALAPDLEDCDQLRELLRPVDGFWIVPKIPHDERPSLVGPRILSGELIRRDAGTSDATHTRQYAAQLLAAADEVESEES